MFLVCSAGSEGASQSRAEWSSQNTTCQSGPQRISAALPQNLISRQPQMPKWLENGILLACAVEKPLLTFTCGCAADKDTLQKKNKTGMFELWNRKWYLRGKQGEDCVLFCLDGVWWSHVVAGDITALASRQGTSEPPIPFSVTYEPENKKNFNKKGAYFTCCHVKRIQSSCKEAALKDSLFPSSVELLPIGYPNIFRVTMYFIVKP